MNTLSEPWLAYFRLQSMVDRRLRADDMSWGFERGLDRCLSEIANTGAVAAETITNAIAVGRAREWYRRRISGPVKTTENNKEWEPNVDPEPGLMARDALRRAFAKFGADEGSLMLALGDGETGAEMARRTGRTQDAVRQRISRLRAKLAA